MLLWDERGLPPIPIGRAHDSADQVDRFCRLYEGMGDAHLGKQGKSVQSLIEVILGRMYKLGFLGDSVG
jgi:hypothetical protein